MKIGRFEIEQLSEGVFELFKNGAFQKLNKQDQKEMKSPGMGGDLSRLVGIDPILVRDENYTILLDAGIGLGLDHKSRHYGTSNLKTNLAIFGIEPEEVDYVILTHLHYDHSGGLVYTDETFRTNAVFPNAKCLVQRSEWDFALQNDKSRNFGFGYLMDDFYRLKSDDRFIFVDKNVFEVIPGITVWLTGGHTPGHQIVQVSDGGESAYYLGDLLPNERNLNSYKMGREDEHPVQARQKKKLLLKKATKEEAIILFYHSLNTKAGKIDVDKDEKFTLINI